MASYEEDEQMLLNGFDHSYNDLQHGYSWMDSALSAAGHVNIDGDRSSNNNDNNQYLPVMPTFSPSSQFSPSSPGDNCNFQDSPVLSTTTNTTSNGESFLYQDFVPRATGVDSARRCNSWTIGSGHDQHKRDQHHHSHNVEHHHQEQQQEQEHYREQHSVFTSPHGAEPSAFASAFQLSIPSCSTEQDNEGSFVVFRITLKTLFSKLEIKRRYRHFKQLHHDLLTRLEGRGVPLPPLPPKRLMSRTNVADTFASTYDHYNTRMALQKYLVVLGGLPAVWQCASFLDFVDCRDPFLGLQVHCTGLTDDVTELRMENAALGRQFCLVHERLEEAVLALSGLQRQVSRLEHQQGTGSGGGTGPSSVEELSPHARSFTLPSSRLTPYSTSSHHSESDHSHAPYTQQHHRGLGQGQGQEQSNRPPYPLPLPPHRSPSHSLSPSHPQYHSRSPSHPPPSSASDHFDTVSLSIPLRSMPPVMRSPGHRKEGGGSIPSPLQTLQKTHPLTEIQSAQHSTASSSAIIPLSSNTFLDGDDQSGYLPKQHHLSSPPSSRHQLQHQPAGREGVVDKEKTETDTGANTVTETNTEKETETLLDENTFAKFFGLEVDSMTSSTEATLQQLQSPKSSTSPSSNNNGNSSNSNSDSTGPEKVNRMTSLLKRPSVPFISAFLHVDTISAASTDPTVLKFSAQMVQMILPNTEQLLYRYNIEKYISKLVRKSLGAQLYQTGLNSLRCFLPDDAISLSVYLCRGLEHSWYIRLNEKLSRMSVGGGTGTGSCNEQEEPGEGRRSSASSTTSLSNTNSITDSPLPSPASSPDKIKISQHSLRHSFSMPITSPTTSTIPPASSSSSGLPAFGSPSHPITNVNVISDDVESVLQCIVGNTTVNIRANMKLDLCFAAFLEEVDQSVGRDHLFKKSLTLVRAWWIYESPKYAPDIDQFNPDIIPKTALCIMVCAVFNLYKDNITSPMHVLMLFLAEYSDFDWNVYTLTIFGRVKRNLIEALPYSSFVKKNGSLFSAPIIQRYQKILHGTSSSTDLYDKTASPDQQKPPQNPSSYPKSAIFTLFERIEEDENEPYTTTENEEYVGSTDIKIYHPLEPNVNVISETILPCNIEGFLKIMRGGATRMNDILKRNATSPESGANSTSENKLTDDLNDFFAVTLDRFASGWRPDVLPGLHSRGQGTGSGRDEGGDVDGDAPKPMQLASMSYSQSSCEVEDKVGVGYGSGVGGGKQEERLSIKVGETGLGTAVGIASGDRGESMDKDKDKDKESIEQDFYLEIGRDPLFVSVDLLAEKIKHCSFLLEAQVTEPVLQRLSKEILQDRGPLPVGEIGKMLQELTSISTLSAYLKERYGGLKKFLELFEDDFIISVDHPFNPHVFLRNTLMPEDIAAITGGSIPLHLSTKANKRRLSRRKRLSSQGSIGSDRGSPSPHTTTGSGTLERSHSMNSNMSHHHLHSSNNNSSHNSSSSAVPSRNHSISHIGRSPMQTPSPPLFAYNEGSLPYSPPSSLSTQQGQGVHVGMSMTGGGRKQFHSNNNHNPSDDRRRKPNFHDDLGMSSGGVSGGGGRLGEEFGSHSNRSTIPNPSFRKEYQQQHQQHHRQHEASHFEYFEDSRASSGAGAGVSGNYSHSRPTDSRSPYEGAYRGGGRM